MPEEILDKEAIGFLIRFFGGTASALTQNVFEWYYTNYPEARGKFPFTRPIKELPLWNDIIVGGISVAEALAGLGIEEDPLKLIPPESKAAAEEFGEGLRQFGEGGVLYSAPMLTKTIITDNIRPGPPGARRRSPSQRKPSQPAAGRGRVIKL